MKAHFNSLAHILAFTGASVASDTPILGEITVANSSQNFAASLAQDIAGYLAGPTSPDEENRFNLLFPGVQTNDMFQFSKADDEAYLTEADDSDIRNAGATFKRVQYRGTTVTDSTIQKGLTIRVDHKRLPKLNGTIIPGWEQRYAAQLKKRLIRADKVRGLALLDAAATNANVTWSSTSNPDGDLRAMVQLTRTGSGMLPTHVVIGNAAMQARIDAYEAAARTNDMANHGSYTMEALARYLGSGQVVLEDGIKQTAKGAAKTDVLGLVAYSYSAEDSPLVDDPSNIKRAWSPVLGGGEWGTAIQEATVYTDITVWHDSKIFIPLTGGIRKITVSLS